MAFQQTTVRSPWAAVAASVALVGIGTYFLKESVFDVLAAARRHETVSLNTKGVLMAPLFILIGLIAGPASLWTEKATALGTHFTDEDTRQLKPLGMVLVAVPIVLSAGLYLWLRSELIALGYDP